MVHTGSRGFGHGLATHFIQEGKEYLQKKGIDVRGGAEAVYFEPDNPLYNGYRNAVGALRMASITRQRATLCRASASASC